MVWEVCLMTVIAMGAVLIQKFINSTPVVSG